MKFTYDEEPDRGECLAYIDRDGDLVVWDCAGKGGAVVLTCGHAESGFDFEPLNAKKKFYPGDNITITF